MNVTSVNQSRDIFISNKTSTNTGDVSVLDAYTNSIASGLTDVVVIQKDSSGNTKRVSQLIPRAGIKSVKKTAAVTKVPGYASFTPTASTAGNLYEVILTTNNWGSDSVNNQYIKPAGYTMVTSDTALLIAKGLQSEFMFNWSKDEPLVNTNFYHPVSGFTTIGTAAPGNGSVGQIKYKIGTGAYIYTATNTATAINDDTNLSWVSAVPGTTVIGTIYAIRTSATTATFNIATATDGTVTTVNMVVLPKNAYYDFVFLASTGVCTIVAKDQEFIVNKKKGSDLDFAVVAGYKTASDGFITNTPLTVTKVGAVINPLDNRYVREMESYAHGEKGDIYKGMGYPLNFEDTLVATSSSAFTYCYTINFATQGSGMLKGTEQLATVMIFTSAADGTGETQDIEEAIEAAFGVTLT